MEKFLQLCWKLKCWFSSVGKEYNHFRLHSSFNCQFPAPETIIRKVEILTLKVEQINGEVNRG